MTDLSVLFPMPTKKRYYRTKFQIAALIIECTSKGAKTKTQLMYHSFLNYSTMTDEYLPFLIEHGLLLAHADGYYTTTEKGLKFLTLYQEIREVIEKK